MSKEHKVPDVMYEQFIKLWVYQDQLKWSRVNWAITIEAASIAGSFIRPGVMGFCLMIMASAFLCLLSGMVLMDKRDAKEVRKIIERFHEESGIPDAHIISQRPGKWLSGTGVLVFSLIIAVLVNSAVAVAHLMYLSGYLTFSACVQSTPPR